MNNIMLYAFFIILESTLCNNKRTLIILVNALYNIYVYSIMLMSALHNDICLFYYISECIAY